MKNKTIWVIVSCLMVAGLLLASCAPAAPTTTPTTAPTTAPTTEKPAVTEKITAPVPAEEPKYGGTLTYVGEASGKTGMTRYDGYRFQDTDSLFSHGFAYEKLLIADWAADRKVFDFPEPYGLIPWQYLKGNLLESWEQPDPLTLICHVRHGVRYQNKPPVNGREFTANDAVWVIDWLRNSPFIPHSDDRNIESTRVLDKYTFEIKFKPPPTQEQLRVLDDTFWYFIAPECVGKSKEIEDWKKMIGTGPFMIEDHVAGSSTTFVRNPDYWGYDDLHPENRLPYVDTVKFLAIPDLATLYAAFRTGKLERIGGIEVKDAESLLRTNPKLSSRRLPSASTTMYRMRVDLEPFTDVRVRQAMNMAIDREEIVRTFFKGYATPKMSAIGPLFADAYTPYGEYPPDVQEVLSYNPEKAKKLLAEAGYPDGFKTIIDYVTVLAYGPEGSVEILQSYLAAIGIEAELRLHDYNTWVTLSYGKKYTGITSHWMDNWPRASRHLQWFVYPALTSNTGNVNDPVLIKMYEDAMATLDRVEYVRKVKEIDAYIVKQAYAIFWPHRQVMHLWQPWLKGYRGEGYLDYANAGSLYARVWVDQELKKEMTGRR